MIDQSSHPEKSPRPPSMAQRGQTPRACPTRPWCPGIQKAPGSRTGTPMGRELSRRRRILTHGTRARAGRKSHGVGQAVKEEGPEGPSTNRAAVEAHPRAASRQPRRRRPRPRCRTRSATTMGAYTERGARLGACRRGATARQQPRRTAGVAGSRAPHWTPRRRRPPPDECRVKMRRWGGMEGR